MIHALVNNLIKGRLSCKQGIATWSVWTFLWPLWPSQCIVSRSLLYWLSCHEAYHKAIYLISLVRLIMLSFTNRQYSSRSYFTLSTCVVVALFVCLFVCFNNICLRINYCYLFHRNECWQRGSKIIIEFTVPK